MWASLLKKTFFAVCPSGFLFSLCRASVLATMVAAGFLSSASAAPQDSAPTLPQAAKAKLDAMASRMADQIRQSKIDPALPKIFVIDFSNANDNQFTKLGSMLADDFAESLSSFASGFQVEDRKEFSEYLKENWMGLDDLQSEAVCLTLARSMGGAGVVRGTIEKDVNQQLRVSLRTDGLGAAWTDAVQLPLTAALEQLSKQPAASFARSADAVQAEPGVMQPGVDGVSLPVCVYCPSPDYTDLARTAKYRGTVELSLLVTKEGTVESAVVLKGAPFSLAEQAVEAVKKWKFKPAKMAGRSVPVRVPVDIEFQLY
ncbi:MAG: energy transducer TonB [Candidatus Acidiferrum sp.]